ncbi:MAG TPA: IS200/IS605 family transposase [bacterium]
MSHRAFSKIYLHIIWHTKGNLPLITPDVQKVIYSTIRQRCDKSGVILFGFGGTEDHIHFAVKIPPSLQITAWIGELKGASSYNVNQACGRESFTWQEGYGVVSFREKELDFILKYIENQVEHHASGKIISSLENISEE